MSHYAVAVFANDGDFNRLLAPYNENDFKVFEPVPYQEIVEEFNRFKAENPAWTLEDYIKEFGYIQQDGQYGYMHNPNGYWDYYTLDGRDYLFDPKEGVELPEDQYDYRKNDIEWYPKDSEADEEAGEFWDKYIDGEEDEGYPSLWSREYYRERYVTREQYIKEMQNTRPYAFITPDGVWHAPGRVGWWATSDDTAESYNKYMEEWDAWIASDENPYVNFVDCHI